jgi:hypothetical protein
MKVKSERPDYDLEGPDLCISLKDAESLVVTWHLSDEVKAEVEQRFSSPLHELPFVLRLYDVTERPVKNDGHDRYVDFDINVRAGEWILHGIEQERRYCVDLGVRMAHGRFYSLSRSPSITS